MSIRTTFLWIMIASFAVTALVGIVVILLPDLIGRDEEVLLTALLLGLYSLPPLGCSIVIGRGRRVPFMWAGILASTLAWCLWVPMIWGNPYNWDFFGVDWDVVFFKTGFTLTFIALWVVHFGLIDMLRLDRHAFRTVRRATLIITGVLVWIGILTMWFEIDAEWLFRGIGVLGILTACGTVVTPILALIELLQRRTGGETVPSRIAIEVRCPRCGEMQSMKSGANTCANCKLRIRIEVEEPRCTCGYLLYQLHGDQCPECGRAIPADQRWAAQTVDGDHSTP